MDHITIRRHILTAMFTDDELMESLVLKGGNALELVHQLSSRASIDMDFSMGEPTMELDELHDRILKVLGREFQRVGYVVIDFSIREKPGKRREGLPDWWGGYVAEFKLVDAKIYSENADNIELLRRRALNSDAKQGRKFKIDISKHEFVGAKMSYEVDDLTVYVYTPEMVALEKLRAICQQMPEYTLGVNHGKSARARDFYDISAVISHCDIDLSTTANHELCRQIFAAKEVPLALIAKISDVYDFHLPDWVSVEASAIEKVESFQYYFDFVVETSQLLKALWDE